MGTDSENQRMYKFQKNEELSDACVAPGRTKSVVSKSTPPLFVQNGVKVGTFVASHQVDENQTKMSDFRKSSVLCDACLITESDQTKILAHILVLSVASEFFRGLFKQNKEGLTIAPLKEVSGKVLSQIVDFIYTGEITLSEDDVEEFMKWSIEYQLPNLTSACEKFLILNLNVNTFQEYQNIAPLYGCEILRQEIEHFIDANFMEFYKSKEFQMTGIEHLKKILSRDSLRCDSEENIFAAVVHWLKFNPEEREQQLMELVPHIRFPLLSPNFILKNVDAFSGCTDALKHYIEAMQLQLFNDSKVDVSGFCATPRLFRTTTVFRPLAHYKKGFFTYDVANQSWKNIYTVNSLIYLIISRDGHQVLFIKNAEAMDHFLIDLTDPTHTERMIAPLVYDEFEVTRYATCIVKSEVYLIGGSCNEILTNKVSVFDLNTNEMREVAPMEVARHLSRAILFNNCIYVLGGTDGKDSLCDVEKFDIETGKWSTVAPLLNARREPHCFIYNNKLYVFGLYAKAVECYDFAEDEWSVVLSELPIDVVFNALVIEDEFYVTRGKKSYRYDEESSTWIELAPFPIL